MSIQYCNVYGTIYKSNGNIVPFEKIIIKRVEVDGALISTNDIIYKTTSNGTFSFNLPQGSVAWIYTSFLDKWEKGTPVSIPYSTSAELTTLIDTAINFPDVIPFASLDYSLSSHTHSQYSITSHDHNQYATSTELQSTSSNIVSQVGYGYKTVTVFSSDGTEFDVVLNSASAFRDGVNTVIVYVNAYNADNQYYYSRRHDLIFMNAGNISSQTYEAVTNSSYNSGFKSSDLTITLSPTTEHIRWDISYIIL